MRPFALPALLLAAVTAVGQQPLSSAVSLPDAPSQSLMPNSGANAEGAIIDSAFSPVLAASSAPDPFAWSMFPLAIDPQVTPSATPATIPLTDSKGRPVELDRDGNPITLENRQPKRILGFMPNFRSVSNGAAPPPPSLKYNFKVATHQAFDYSSFIFLGITSLSAEGINSHPALGKGVGGFYAYTWRGFVDKTDGTYLSAFILPTLLREDTRFYSLGHGTILHRTLYVISRQAVARTYGGRDTPNIAGLGGKVLTQVISREYYPTSATNFSTLATKFGYSVARDIGFTSIREFYPTAAAHYVRKHRAKQLAAQQQTATP